MKAAFLLLLALAGFRLSGADTTLNQPVRTLSGLLQGAANAEGSVTAFKGIPYAAPPVGDLRWREPQPPPVWEGVRPALSFGASCPQPASTFAPPYTREFAATGPTDEDCLFLNVWAPSTPGAGKRGVLVYVHGGSGIRGSGSVPVYDGEELARKGIVVVTLNFRLGLLGGMGHPELTAESPHRVCGNYGMLDLIAALRWVRANIAAFGGDPDKVTLCGQSSGCMALHYLTISPLAKGLFQRAIAVSFPCDYLLKPHAIGNVWQKEQQGIKFAAAKKVKGIRELRALTPAELMAEDPAVEPFTRAALGGGMNTDGWSFPMEYHQALEQGLVADVPLMIGITADDFGPPAERLKTTVASFAADLPGMFGVKKDAFLSARETYLAFCPAGTDREARELAKRAQREYRLASVFDWAERRSATGRSPLYTYRFDQPIPWPEHPEFGVFHSSDLIYAFHNLRQLNRPWTDEDRRVAGQVSSFWVNFVNTGNPSGPGLPTWNPFDPNSFTTMRLGVKPDPEEIAPPERAAFYRSLLNPPADGAKPRPK